MTQLASGSCDRDDLHFFFSFVDETVAVFPDIMSVLQLGKKGVRTIYD